MDRVRLKRSNPAFFGILTFISEQIKHFIGQIVSGLHGFRRLTLDLIPDREGDPQSQSGADDQGHQNNGQYQSARRDSAQTDTGLSLRPHSPQDFFLPMPIQIAQGGIQGIFQIILHRNTILSAILSSGLSPGSSGRLHWKRGCAALWQSLARSFPDKTGAGSSACLFPKDS